MIDNYFGITMSYTLSVQGESNFCKLSDLHYINMRIKKRDIFLTYLRIGKYVFTYTRIKYKMQTVQI